MNQQNKALAIKMANKKSKMPKKIKLDEENGNHLKPNNNQMQHKPKWNHQKIKSNQKQNKPGNNNTNIQKVKKIIIIRLKNQK